MTSSEYSFPVEAVNRCRLYTTPEPQLLHGLLAQICDPAQSRIYFYPLLVQPMTLPPPRNPAWPQAGANGKRRCRSWRSSHVAREEGSPDHCTRNWVTKDEPRATIRASTAIGIAFSEAVGERIVKSVVTRICGAMCFFYWETWTTGWILESLGRFNL